jgi:MFS family permease
MALLVIRKRPEDMGFPSMRQMEGKSSHPASKRHWWDDLKSVVGTRAAWPVLWVDLGMVGSMLAFVGLWAIPFLRDVHGLARSAAAVYTTSALAGFAVGSMLVGWFSDRIGRRKPVILGGTLLYACACLGLAWLPWHPGPVGIAQFALLGLSAGGFVVTFANAKEVVAPALSGMAVGLVNTGLFFGAAVMQPLFGWALDLNWNGRIDNGIRVYAPSDYHTGFLLMLGCALIAVAGASRIKETCCRNITID